MNEKKRKCFEKIYFMVWVLLFIPKINYTWYTYTYYYTII